MFKGNELIQQREAVGSERLVLLLDGEIQEKKIPDVKKKVDSDV